MKTTRNLFNLAVIVMVICVTSSCKKKAAIAPETKAEALDIREYVLVTRETNSNNWVVNINLRSFEAQSKSIVFNEGGRIPDNGFTYSYENGVLKLFYDGRLNQELKIENKTIAPKKLSGITTSYQLIKIPTENPFNGTTYSGGWKSEGSLLTTVATLKFTDTHYSEASLNIPVPNKTYELFKNLAAYKNDLTNNVKTVWLLSDGKMEGYRKYNSGNSVTGTFSKQ